MSSTQCEQLRVEAALIMRLTLRKGASGKGAMRLLTAWRQGWRLAFAPTLASTPAGTEYSTSAQLRPHPYSGYTGHGFTPGISLHLARS